MIRHSRGMPRRRTVRRRRAVRLRREGLTCNTFRKQNDRRFVKSGTGMIHCRQHVISYQASSAKTCFMFLTGLTCPSPLSPLSRPSRPSRPSPSSPPSPPSRPSRGLPLPPLWLHPSSPTRAHSLLRTLLRFPPLRPHPPLHTPVSCTRFRCRTWIRDSCPVRRRRKKIICEQSS